MADTHETVADIIAWLRRPREGENGYLTAWRDEIADRVEAANKREVATTKESLAVGNSGDCAKLREALKLCLRGMCGYCRMDAEARGMTTECVNGCEVMLGAKAALAAPTRNCDRFGSSTQARAEWYKTEVLPRVEGVVSGVEPPFVDWLFAPATEQEGGANG